MSETSIEVIYETTCCACKKSFDNHGRIAKKLKCSHVMCSPCLSIRKRTVFRLDFYSCNVCPHFKNQELMHNKQFLTPRQYIEVLTEDVKVANTKIGEMQKTLTELKVIADRCNFVSVKCYECGNNENEADAQVCRTCIFKLSDNIDNYAKELYSKNSNLDSIAICAACAIRKHIKVGHGVCDFFPIMSSIRYVQYSDSLLPKREIGRKEMNEMKRSVQQMLDVFEAGEKELDVMTDMMKRQKTSFSQQDLYHKIQYQVVANNVYVEKLTAMLKFYELRKKKMIGELYSENNIQDSAEHFSKSSAEEVS